MLHLVLLGFLLSFMALPASMRVLGGAPVVSRQTDEGSLDIIALPDEDYSVPEDTGDSQSSRKRSMLEVRSLNKRQNIRVINNCPGDAGPGANQALTRFQGSQCDQTHNIRDYIIRCGVPGGGGVVLPYFSSCRQDEFCVDGVTSQGNPTAAYCISIEGMISGLLQLKNTEKYGSVQKTARFTVSGTSGSDYMLEAVVSGQQGVNQVFSAGYLSIEGRDKNDNYIAGTRDACEHCTSIGLEPLPPGFDHALVNVGLPNPGDTANLYGGLVKAGSGF